MTDRRRHHRPVLRPAEGSQGEAAADGQRDGPSRPARLVGREGRPPLAVLGPDGSLDDQQALAFALAQGDPELLVATCWQLGHERFTRLVLARGLPFDVADDVLQEVFALLSRELDRVRGPRIMGWLATMVELECRRHCTRQARAHHNAARARYELQHISHHQAASQLADNLGHKRDLAVAVEFVAGLEPVDQCILQAFLLEGLPTTQIAARVEQRFGEQVSVQAVRMRRLRLRRQLSQQIIQKRRGSDNRRESDA